MARACRVENRPYPLPEVPYLKLAAVHDDRNDMLTLFALNRHLGEPMSLSVQARDFSALELAEAHALHDDDLDAVNTKDAPDRIRSAPLAEVAIDGRIVSTTLAPASWNVIRLAACD